MDEIQQLQLNSVEELFEYIERNLITRNHHLGFRGHSDSNWKLEPTIVRFMHEAIKIYGKTDRTGHYDSLDFSSHKLYETFKKNITVNQDIEPSQIENIDLWQYGQHFGLPSPLLDWTYSPYIALFFALSDFAAENKERCIWIINLELLSFLNKSVVEDVRPQFKDSISPREYFEKQFPQLTHIEEINQVNRRLAFQQGFFTKLETYQSIEIWLQRSVSQLDQPNCDRCFLTKISFPCTIKDRLQTLDKLDSMNINNRTLFPDIFGSVKDAIDNTMREFQSPRYKSYSFSVD